MLGKRNYRWCPRKGVNGRFCVSKTDETETGPCAQGVNLCALCETSVITLFAVKYGYPFRENPGPAPRWPVNASGMSAITHRQRQEFGECH